MPRLSYKIDATSLNKTSEVPDLSKQRGAIENRSLTSMFEVSAREHGRKLNTHNARPFLVPAVENKGQAAKKSWEKSS